MNEQRLMWLLDKALDEMNNGRGFDKSYESRWQRKQIFK